MESGYADLQMSCQGPSVLILVLRPLIRGIPEIMLCRIRMFMRSVGTLHCLLPCGRHHGRRHGRNHLVSPPSGFSGFNQEQGSRFKRTLYKKPETLLVRMSQVPHLLMPLVLHLALKRNSVCPLVRPGICIAAFWKPHIVAPSCHSHSCRNTDILTRN